MFLVTSFFSSFVNQNEKQNENKGVKFQLQLCNFHHWDYSLASLLGRDGGVSPLYVYKNKKRLLYYLSRPKAQLNNGKQQLANFPGTSPTVPGKTPD